MIFVVVGAVACVTLRPVVNQHRYAGRNAKLGIIELRGPDAAQIDDVLFLYEILKHEDDAEMRFRAVACLGRLKNQDVEVVRSISEALKDADFRIRAEAAKILGKRGRAVAMPAVPDLCRLLCDSHRGVRMVAAGILYDFGERREEALSVLLDALYDPELRIGALSWLRDTNAQADSIQTAVTSVINDACETMYVRLEAAQTLWELCHSAKPIMPLLITALKEGEAIDRMHALTVLTQIGPCAAEATPMRP